MEKDLKDILLKDLSARLPYDVKVQYYDNGTKKFEVGTIISCTIPIDETYQKYPTFITSRDLLIIQGNIIEDIKPYLFPISSMTKEQDKEFMNIQIGYPSVDWFNKYHIDYRGLIEKGLAIDATGLNIY